MHLRIRCDAAVLIRKCCVLPPPLLSESDLRQLRAFVIWLELGVRRVRHALDCTEAGHVLCQVRACWMTGCRVCAAKPSVGTSCQLLARPLSSQARFKRTAYLARDTIANVAVRLSEAWGSGMFSALAHQGHLAEPKVLRRDYRVGGRGCTRCAAVCSLLGICVFRASCMLRE